METITKIQYLFQVPEKAALMVENPAPGSTKHPVTAPPVCRGQLKSLPGTIA